LPGINVPIRAPSGSDVLQRYGGDTLFLWCRVEKACCLLTGHDRLKTLTNSSPLQFALPCGSTSCFRCRDKDKNDKSFCFLNVLFEPSF
jgi:hypothetical protein